MTRIIVLLIFLGTTAVSAESWSQSRRISIEIEDSSLIDVLDQIQYKSGYTFLFSSSDVSGIKGISVNAERQTVAEILDHCLSGTQIVYELNNRVIVLKKNEAAQSQQRQLIRISGIVVDESGNPIAGAAVVLKSNSQYGMATDAAGRFAITVPDTGSTMLVVSFLGRVTREVTYAGQEELRIVLTEDSQVVEEVVITGIFERRAESFTGSAQTFSKEQLRRVGNTNLLQSIKNLDPSFRIMEDLVNGSNPNVMPIIHLRGQSGFPDLKGEYSSDPNQPLFILDGFETTLTQILDMDMNRVESVTLLKDAAAKAIYGAKAANGVVVVETTPPAKGQFRVSYTGNLNLQFPDLDSYDICNAAEKFQAEINAGLYIPPISYHISGYPMENPSTETSYAQVFTEVLENVMRGVDTDWMSKPLRNGVGQKHVLALDGGSDEMRYMIDFSYNDVKGVMKGSDRNTLSGGITLSYRYKNLTFREHLEVGHSKGNNSSYGSFSEYVAMNPYYPTHDENGNVLKILAQNFVQAGVVTNPLWNTTLQFKDFTQYTTITNNFYVEYQVLPQLKITGRLGYTWENNGAEQFRPASHTMFDQYRDEMIARKGLYTKMDGKGNSLASDINATYSASFGKHLVFANVGYSISSKESSSVTVVAEGFPNDRLDDISFARQYAKDQRPSSNEYIARELGVLGVVNYSYDDRYLFDASLRGSASSQFGSNNRWGKFWALGVGWNLHNEKFMEGVKFIDRLKVRASLGFSGSQNFNSFMSQATYLYYTNKTYKGNFGVYLQGLTNPNLRWQRKYDRNIGIDLVLLERKLNFRFDFYDSTTDDQLTDISLPYSTGFESYKENLGETQNRGYEFMVSYRVWSLPEKDAFLNIYASGSHNKNRVRKISNSLAAYNAEQVADANTKPVVRFIEGSSMSSIWAVPSLGIDPATGRDIFVRPDGTTTFTWNENYLAVCGDTEPTMQGNFGVNFDYMGFSFNASLGWRFGGQLYNQTLVDKVENANIRRNVDRRIFEERWVNPGDVTRFKDAKDTSITRATERFVEDNDELLFSSVNISYDLNRLRVVNILGLQLLRLSFDMGDVARLSSVKVERGTDYPFARSFSLSLRAIF